MLSSSGVDITKFKAHSTRAASVSAARAQFVPVSEILSLADWASEGTFQRFYNKPVVRNSSTVSSRLLALST